MQQTHQSAWWSIGIGLAGLVIGYILVLLWNDPHVFAQRNSCPAEHNPTCIAGECTKDCHGICDKNSA